MTVVGTEHVFVISVDGAHCNVMTRLTVGVTRAVHLYNRKCVR